MPRLLSHRPDDETNPFPHLKPGAASKGSHRASLATRKTEKGAGSLVGTMVATLESQEGQRSTTGAVHGMAASRGFLDAQSEASRRQHERLDDNVIDTYRRGRERQMDIARQRKEVTAEFETPAPPQWTSMSRSVHVNLLPAMDASASLTMRQVPRPKKKSDGSFEKSVGSGAGLQKTHTHYAEEYARRTQAMADTDALAAFHRENLAASMKKTGHKASWVGGPPCSTYADAMQRFDIAETDRQMHPHSSTPVPQGTLARALAEETAHLEETRSRRARRYDGDYATTAATTFVDKTKEGERATHTRSHYFEYSNGTIQMPTRGNNPLRKTSNMHVVQNTSVINPAQYMTMKDQHEKMAIAGLGA